MLIGVQLLFDAAPEERAVDRHALHQRPPPMALLARVLRAPLFQIDPVGLEDVRAVARLEAFECVGRQLVAHVGPQPQGQDDVVAKAAEEHGGPRGGVTNPLGDHCLVQFAQGAARHHHLTAGGHQLPGHHFGQGAAVLVARGGHGNALAGAEGHAEIVQHHVAIRILDPHPLERHLSLEMRQALGRAVKEILLDHPGGREAFGDRLPAQGHVLKLVVVGQKLFPGAGEVLVGRQCRHQGAHRDAPGDRQVAPDGVEEEGRQLADEVVEELHEELLLEDLEPQRVEPPEPVRNHGHPVAPAAIDAQGAGPHRALANLRRKGTHLNDALLVQEVDLALQLGDQPSLERDKRAGRQAEGPALEEKKAQDRQHLPGLEHWLGYSIAHQAAHGLGFRCHHRHELTLARALEVGRREAQDAGNQGIAEAPQQPLGKDAFHRVDAHLHDAVQQDRQQEEAAEQHQEGDLPHLVAHDVDPVRGRADGVVDDPLGQFQGEIEQREERDGDAQKRQLVPFRVLPDEGEE